MRSVLSFVAVGLAALSGVVAAPFEGSASAAIQARAAATPASVPVIITTLQTKIAPACAELTYFTKANATTAAITPVLLEIKAAVDIAVTDVKLLVGKPVAVILAGVDTTVAITVIEVAKLIAVVLTLVVSSLGKLLATVDGDLAILGPVLYQLGGVLADLVGGLLYVVDGLLLQLGPLLVTVVATVKGLLFFTLGGILRIL